MDSCISVSRQRDVSVSFTPAILSLSLPPPNQSFDPLSAWQCHYAYRIAVCPSFICVFIIKPSLLPAQLSQGVVKGSTRVQTPLCLLPLQFLVPSLGGVPLNIRDHAVPTKGDDAPTTMDGSLQQCPPCKYPNTTPSSWTRPQLSI